MKRSFYMLSPILVLVGIVLSAFGLAPMGVKMAVPAKEALATASLSPTLWPSMPAPQQTPLSYTFRLVYECPPEGKGADNPADAYQNKLKNRVDEGAYKLVKVDDILRLYPTKDDYGPNSKDKVSESRTNWTDPQKDKISLYEGSAVSVEGYIFYVPKSNTNKDELIGAEKSGDEETNCNYTSDEMKDWHITIAGTKDENNREKAIVVETTPRIRENHVGWTLEKLRVIAKNRYKVQISGWLFFDPEHTENLPGQTNVTRGTLWEVHPVMKIEVDVSKDGNGPWYLLDNCERKGNTKTPTPTSTLAGTQTTTVTPTLASKCEL